MGHASKRAFGGAGIAIKTLPSRIRAESSDKFRMHSQVPIDEHLERSIHVAIASAERLGLDPSCDLFMDIALPRHSGLGSGTQILMSALRCVAIEKSWAISPDTFMDISGRSKTSSVGAAVNQLGGFCVDLGCADDVGSAIQYSPEMIKRNRGLILGSWPFPKDWVVSIFCYDLGSSLSGAEEDEFFAKNYPASRQSALETIAALFMGLVPAVLLSDYEGFRESLYILQTTGFKDESVNRQSATVKNVLRDLWSQGYAAGVSSFGPTTFAVHHRKDVGSMQDTAQRFGVSGIYCAEVVNSLTWSNSSGA